MKSIFKTAKLSYNKLYCYTLSLLQNPYKRMTPTSILIPPENVKLMTTLDRVAFKKTVLVPVVIVHQDNVGLVMKVARKYLLKLKNFNPIVPHNEIDNLRKIVLNPDLIKNNDSFADFIKSNSFIINNTFSHENITVEYENWSSDQILRAVLPDNLEVCSSYSRIGHIIHLNLNKEYIIYKYVIGQVYLEKINGINLVVNKTDIIDNSDNTFRTFNMEILASNNEDNNMDTTVKENGCSFTFDFSKVYWNPRLCTEHERIVKKMKKGDVLYDVMAGVGPFSIPAAKKGCIVFANDLNVHSFNALESNILKNKVYNCTASNLDAKDFITGTIKDHLIAQYSDKNFTSNIHITMNLPSLALEFLPCFIGLLYNKQILKLEDLLESSDVNVLPLVHVYFFAFNKSNEYAINAVASKLGFCKETMKIDSLGQDFDVMSLKNNIQPEFLKYISEVFMVREVATTKVMMRVSFHLPKKVLCEPLECNELKDSLRKKQKVN